MSTLWLPPPGPPQQLGADEFIYYAPLTQASTDLYKSIFDDNMFKAQSESQDEWSFHGPISTEDRDYEQQRTLYKAVISGLPHFVNMGATVDWDHQSVMSHDPAYAIGTGIVLSTSPNVDLKTTLHKTVEMAKSVWKLYCARHPLFYSIGGKVLDSSGRDLLKTLITHVAVTLYPVNPKAAIGLPGLAKSLTDRGILRIGRSYIDMGAMLDSTKNIRYLIKALEAGSGPGYDSGGGRALIPEDLEGAPKVTAAPISGRAAGVVRK